MRYVSVREAAEHLGVGEQRVRDRLASGDLEGEKVSGVWLVDPISLSSASRGAGRPFSPRIAWAMIEDIEGRRPSWVSSSELSRLRSRWVHSIESPDPLPLLRDRFANRAKRRRWHAPEPAALLKDERFVASGRSDPRSGMAGGDFAEGYVCTRDLDDVAVDHLLVKPPPGTPENVVLYVTDHRPPSPAPWLLVALDLADGGPRESQQAWNLMATCLADAPAREGREWAWKSSWAHARAHGDEG